MELQIKKVKIDKKGIPEIDYVEVREDGKNPNIAHEGKGTAHDDLINAVRELAPHYALITGYAAFNKGLKLDSLKAGVDNFKVSGYSIGGQDEDEGITIMGHIIVPWSGKAVIINSPFQRFGEEEGNKAYYKFIDRLAEVVEKIVEEAILYIGGKFKPEAQQELVFPEAETGNSNTVVSEGGEISQEEPTT